MLITEKNWFIVEIPKSASSTIQMILDRKFNGTTLNGHHSVKSAIEKNGGESFDRIFAVLRHPEDRLLSAVNFCLSDLNIHPNDRTRAIIEARALLRGAVEGYEKKDGLVRHFCFRTQSSFLDDEHMKIEIFKLEQLDRLAKILGWEDELPVKNASKKWFSLEELKGFPEYKPAIQLYDADWNLYEFRSILEA